MNNIHLSDICDLGERAKIRLSERLNKHNIIQRSLIDTAVCELMMVLSFMGENTDDYALSNKMTLVWQQAILDTLFYKHLCLYSCIKYESIKKTVVHYDPNQIVTPELLLVHQTRTITKFNLIFGRYPNRSLWSEIVSNNDNEITVRVSALLFRISPIGSVSTPFTEYKIKVNKMGGNSYIINVLKERTIQDMFNEVLYIENIDINNLKLIYDGHIIVSNDTVQLTTLFGNIIEPNIYIITRT